jgi:3-oxoadipate enol-lactonase
MLMGLGSDAHGWELQLPAFSARHRVVLVDNRGAGRSGKPPGPYTMGLLADDAAAVLDAAGIARAHVVGISMGGMIAQELVLRHPDRVGALVLAATFARPGAEVRDVTERGSQAILGESPMAVLARGAADLSKLDVQELFRFLMPLVFTRAWMKDNRAFLQNYFLRSMGYGFSLPAFFGQVSAVMAHDTVERLPSVRAPTLVITGSEDGLIPPHHSDELSRLVPGASLERVAGGSHGFNFERAELFNEAVLDFLRRHPLG